MKKMKFNKIQIILFSLALFCYGCNECEPLSDGSTEIVISFFDITKPIENTNNFETLEVKYDSILVVGYSETLLVQEDTTAFFTLPLSPNDSTTFVFMLGNTADSLTLSYQRSISVNSPDCGVLEEILGLAIGNPTSFKQATILKTTVDFSGAGNVSILK